MILVDEGKIAARRPAREVPARVRPPDRPRRPRRARRRRAALRDRAGGGPDHDPAIAHAYVGADLPLRRPAAPGRPLRPGRRLRRPGRDPRDDRRQRLADRPGPAAPRAGHRLGIQPVDRRPRPGRRGRLGRDARRLLPLAGSSTRSAWTTPISSSPRPSATAWPPSTSRPTTAIRSGSAASPSSAGRSSTRRPIRSGTTATYYSGGAGLVSTLDDYATFLQMLLNRGELDGVRLLEARDGRRDDHRPARRPRDRPTGATATASASASASTTEDGRGAPGPSAPISWGGFFYTYFWVDPRNELIGILFTQTYPSGGPALRERVSAASPTRRWPTDGRPETIDAKGYDDVRNGQACPFHRRRPGLADQGEDRRARARTSPATPTSPRPRPPSSRPSWSARADSPRRTSAPRSTAESTSHSSGSASPGPRTSRTSPAKVAALSARVDALEARQAGTVAPGGLGADRSIGFVGLMPADDRPPMPPPRPGDARARSSTLAELDPASPRFATEAVDLLLGTARGPPGPATSTSSPSPRGLVVRCRVDGVLQPVATLPARSAPNVVARLKVLAELLTYRTDIPQEGRIRAAPGQPRDPGQHLPDPPRRTRRRPPLRRPGATARRSTTSACPPTSSTASATPSPRPRASIVLTGPAGSGKTTTLYACLRALADDLGRPSLHRHAGRPDRGRSPRRRPVAGQPGGRLLAGVGGLRSLLRQDPGGHRRRRDPRPDDRRGRLPGRPDRPSRADDLPRRLGRRRRRPPLGHGDRALSAPQRPSARSSRNGSSACSATPAPARSNPTRPPICSACLSIRPGPPSAAIAAEGPAIAAASAGRVARPRPRPGRPRRARPGRGRSDRGRPPSPPA